MGAGEAEDVQPRRGKGLKKIKLIRLATGKGGKLPRCVIHRSIDAYRKVADDRIGLPI